MALVNPLNVTLFQVGDMIETDYTSFNNFLDSIDASYCSPNDATDNVTSPTVDAVYPDPLPGGYRGPRNWYVLSYKTAVCFKLSCDGGSC